MTKAKTADKYAPVAFDPAAYISQRSARDPAFRDAHKALEDEYSTLDMLLRARKEAGMTQVALAERMGIAPSSLARIESSIVSRKHLPSLSTLRKYAQACGKRLTIELH